MRWRTGMASFASAMHKTNEITTWDATPWWFFSLISLKNGIRLHELSIEYNIETKKSKWIFGFQFEWKKKHRTNLVLCLMPTSFEFDAWVIFMIERSSAKKIETINISTVWSLMLFDSTAHYSASQWFDGVRCDEREVNWAKLSEDTHGTAWITFLLVFFARALFMPWNIIFSSYLLRQQQWTVS